MKKLYVKHKGLTLVCLASVLIVILYFITYDIPELFIGAGRMFDILSQIAIGYIINYIFFIVNVFLPQLRSEEKAFQVCELPIVSLLEEIQKIENNFSSFIDLKYGTLRYQTGTIYYQYPNSDGRSFICITDFLKAEGSILQRKFDNLSSNRHFNSLDGKIIELINNLQYSDFVGYLSKFPYHAGDLSNVMFAKNAYTTILSDAYNNFIETAHELRDACHAQISPPKEFIVLEGATLEDYVSFIMEKRASCQKPVGVSEYHVENSRIY